MRKYWLYSVCFSCLLSACSNTPQATTEEMSFIDVAGAMENPAELQLSALGKEVHYVPLETTDSCLIGNNPNLLLLDKHIVVFFGKECLLFSKDNGKFICKVGHAGDDPEAYTNAQPIYNDIDNLLYFKRSGDGLQKYDLSGAYRGKLKLPTTPLTPDEFVFTDSLIIGYYNTMGQQYNARSLVFLDSEGAQVDTVPALHPPLPPKTVNDIVSISIRRQGLAGLVLSDFSDGTSSASIAGIPFLWKFGDKIHFKESFNDTIYTVERDKLVPTIVFSTGKWHWGSEARISQGNAADRLLMTAVFETENSVFFQCTRDMYGKEPEVFNGIYDRKAGVTRMYNQKAGIIDDLIGFMPFHPKTYNAKGEYGMIVNMDEIMTWQEEHPEEAKNEKLAVLKTLTEDANPVVVIVK